MVKLSELQIKILRVANKRDANGELVPVKALWEHGNCYVTGDCLAVLKDEGRWLESNLESETLAPLITHGFLEIRSQNEAGKTLFLTAQGMRKVEDDNGQAESDVQSDNNGRR